MIIEKHRFVNNWKSDRKDAIKIVYNKQRNLVNRLLKNAENGCHNSFSENDKYQRTMELNSKLGNFKNPHKNKFSTSFFRGTTT